MATGTRASHRRPHVSSVPPSQGDGAASSGTTVPDEYIHTVNGRQDCDDANAESREASQSTIADEALPLGEHMNEVISVVSKLEGLGLQRLQIPLPKCVVLGEQSTGKSSVIEAISGIKTPRSTDTCTRCPLFIKMEPSHSEWHAKVILRQSYSYDGKLRSKFPGWIPNPKPTDIEFDSTSSVSTLEELIARAQLAALSPMSDPMEFLPPSPLDRDLDTYHKTQFSPNVVCIHVTGPELPALSFYDLPGVIGQAESSDTHFLVKFVRDLVIEYIKDPESLILVTCSLETDIMNSAASGIARDLKATNRCIGVLTKPDRLPVGSRADKLQAVLDGNRFTLGYGYYVVKNPGQDDIDRGLTHRDARMQEQQYFETVEPWATTFREYQDRLGTQALQKCLSETLASQMSRSLPVIRAQVHTRLNQIDTELKSLPEPPTHNATRIISDMVLSFSNHVRREIEGDYPCRTWRNTWTSLHKDFYDGLLSMKPTLVSLGALDKGIFDAATPGKTAHDALVIDSEDEDEDAPMFESPETPSKKRKAETPPSSMRPPPSRLQTPARHTPARQTPIPSLDLNPTRSGTKPLIHLRKRFELDVFASELKEKSKSRLPDQLDPKVTDEVILETLMNWDQPMRRFFDGLRGQLTSTMRSIFDEHFGQWSASPLSREAWDIVEQTLKTNFHHLQVEAAVDSLNDEREGPYVFNEDVFYRERFAMREHYRDARLKARVKLYGREMLAQTGKAFTPQDEERLRKDEKKQAVLKLEPYEKEIGVISWVTSYYMVAARRFYESICIRIESKFFKQLKTTLRDDLDSELGIHEHDNGARKATQLLAEPTQRAEKRKELVAMKNALLQGLAMLEGLESKYSDNPLRSSQSANVAVNGHTYSSFGPTSTPLTEEMEDITRSGMARR